MNIYKLSYDTRKKALKDLVKKKVYNKSLLGKYSKADGIDTVVELGKVESVEATYDENDIELTPAEYFPGYGFDILTTKTIDFGENEINPEDPKHKFAGIE
tara:strand:+ start:4912 stop:5214 length:303 start_codon:yes stop_codon:yes gene_type:complete